jgi:AmmeMemoRadiSam system protein B
MKRDAAVAGQFYHGSLSRLKQQVEQYIDPGARKSDVIGMVVPHAGFIYSGAVAGQAYSSINLPKTFVMLGPNHTGLGPGISIMAEGVWEVPNGSFEIDRKLASRIIQNTSIAEKDMQAHIFEHSLEVQLPFIAHLGEEIKIVPIALLSASFEDCCSLAEGIVKAVKTIDYPITLLASTDFSHYVPDKIARQKDQKAIDRIIDIDPKGLYETVLREKISMCGYLPTTVTLYACKLLGAHTARLIRYMTSGDVSGDFDSVVGYAGIIIY